MSVHFSLNQVPETANEMALLKDATTLLSLGYKHDTPTECWNPQQTRESCHAKTKVPCRLHR